MKVEMEFVSGIAAMLVATVATATGRDIGLWSAVAAGMAGIFGTFAFMHTAKLDLSGDRIITVLVGAGLASLFGPLVANAMGHYFQWLGTTNYFVDAACGAGVGLASTPVLGFLRAPGPMLGMILAALVPWGKKKD